MAQAHIRRLQESYGTAIQGGMHTQPPTVSSSLSHLSVIPHFAICLRDAQDGLRQSCFHRRHCPSSFFPRVTAGVMVMTLTRTAHTLGRNAKMNDCGAALFECRCLPSRRQYAQGAIHASSQLKVCSVLSLPTVYSL